MKKLVLLVTVLMIISLLPACQNSTESDVAQRPILPPEEIINIPPTQETLPPEVVETLAPPIDVVEPKQTVYIQFDLDGVLGMSSNSANATNGASGGGYVYLGMERDAVNLVLDELALDTIQHNEIISVPLDSVQAKSLIFSFVENHYGDSTLSGVRGSFISPRGLRVGDPFVRVAELYGEDYVIDSSAPPPQWVYRTENMLVGFSDGGNHLNPFAEGGTIHSISIEWVGDDLPTRS